MATKTRKSPTHGRILIMDSDQETVKLLMHDLGEEGYRIEIAEYTNRCFEKIKNEQIDVLILAVEAWGVKGYELIPIIKKINSLLPIIATSADDSMEVAARVREQGVFFYAIKPLDMKEIKLAIKNALNRKFTRRHAFLHKEAEKQKDLEDEILDLAGASKILKLSKKMVSNLAKKGEIPASRIGNKWHFIRNQLLEWLRIMAAGNQKNYGTLILETMDEGVAVVDKRLRVVGCNSAYLQALDVPRDRIIGEYCYRVSHRSNVPCDEPACPVRKAFKTKRPVKSMHINYDSDGNEHYCDIIALPMKDEQGKVNQVLEVIRDNTEIYNLNKHLSLIMCFFARESKKTLGPVVMNISALIDEKLSKTISEEKHNEMLLVCICNLKLMQDMIRNYMVSYKGEKGELHCNKQITDLYENIIKPVIEEFQPILLKTEMTVEISVKKQRSVYCDPDLMKIVFSNLIHNATKYGVKNTAIKCSLNIKEKDFELTVFNKGIGIPRDKLTNIFEPFTRFSRDGIRGTGLGLHVVKMIAEMHEGILKAESGYFISGRPVAYDEFYADTNLCKMKKKDLEKFARFILTIPTCEEVQTMEV
ncbi:MAG: ATP-binding protein [bacterium]